MRPSRAFTLVELLVVISIIALLIALLMPSLGKVHETSRLTQCQSTKRSLILGYSAYSVDNNGKLMIGVPANHPQAFVYPGGDESAITRGALYQYVPGLEAYQCPEDPNGNLRSYSIPGTLYGEGWKGGDQQGTDRLSAIVQPVNQILFFEESDHRGWNVGSWLMRCAKGNEYRWVDYAGLFHLEETADNIAFMDGHIEVRKWEDPDTIRAGLIRRFYLVDPNNADWDWLRSRYRQIAGRGNVEYISARN